MKFDTKLIHSGYEKKPLDRAVVLPIFHSSTYIHQGENEYKENVYTRLANTPNQLDVSLKLSGIEGGEKALVTSSGMAAISTSLLALVGKDEHLLAIEDLYGGTHQFLKHDFPRLGRNVSFFSIDDDLTHFLKKETRAIYIESVSNPLLKIPDFENVISFAKKNDLITLIDNTFPSPVNFNPINFGFDIVIHSATKYLNGHSDLIAGAVIGSETLINRIHDLLIHLGGTLDAYSSGQLSRSLKTLSVRVKKQCETAQLLAKTLFDSKLTKKVFYPGLESHVYHGRALKYFRGFGGIVAFELPTMESTHKFLKAIKLPFYAPSLGGVETLITRPVISSHSGLSLEDRNHLGISETLIRVSVGLEDFEDLKFDFLQALEIANS